jgi:hypothetical protein
MIPKIIHQVYLGNIPAEIQSRMGGVQRMNGDFTYRLHSSTKSFEDDSYVQWILSSRAPLAFLVDRIRLLALMREGGFYVDADALACRPLSTLEVFSDPKIDFVFGMRSPDRNGVGLHGPIALVDNTFMGSAKGGRLVRKLLELYHPGGKVQNGSTVGKHILRHMDQDTRVFNFRYFYGEQKYPESVFLHDSINLASWVQQKDLAYGTIKK